MKYSSIRIDLNHALGILRIFFPKSSPLFRTKVHKKKVRVRGLRKLKEGKGTKRQKRKNIIEERRKVRVN